MEAGSQELGRAFGGDGHYVFAADAEFVRDVDAGLVGEGHAGFEDGFALVDEIRMFVDVEADAMAEAVREEFVPGAVAGGSDDGASGVIHGAGKFSCAGGIEGRVLGFADAFKRALDFFRPRIFTQTPLTHLTTRALWPAA